LISHLYALENDIQEKLSTIEEKVATEFENFITELTEQKDSVVQLQEKMDAIKTHASEFQTFLGMEELKAEVESKKKYIQSLAHDNRKDKISISHSIEEKITAFLTDILKFGG
jgi:predicted RNA-binding protein Jag